MGCTGAKETAKGNGVKGPRKKGSTTIKTKHQPEASAAEADDPEPLLNALPAAADQESTAHMWGSGESGKLGLGDDAQDPQAQPDLDVSVHDLPASAVQLSIGGYHAAVVTHDGLVYVWGCGRRGQLGLICPTDYGTAKLVEGMPDSMSDVRKIRFSQVCCGWYHTLALTEDGQVWVWGFNEEGQLGVDTFTDKPVPAHMSPGTALEGLPLVQLSAAKSTSGAVTRDGHVYTWGTGLQGQLGLGMENNEKVPPTRVMGKLSDQVVVQLSLGSNHSGCITYMDEDAGNLYSDFEAKDGATQLFAWGAGNPQGLWKETNPWHPQLIEGASLESRVFVQYSAGKSMSALVCQDGAVFTWGPSGKHGQLGHGDEDRNLSPKQVVDLIDHVVVQLETSESATHTVVLTQEGKLLSWGRDSDGQLGAGTAQLEESDEEVRFSSKPVEVVLDQAKVKGPIAHVSVGCSSSGVLCSSTTYAAAGAKYFEGRVLVCQRVLHQKRARKHQDIADREKARLDGIKRAKKKEQLKVRRAKEKAEKKQQEKIMKDKKFIANNEKYYGAHSVQLRDEINRKEWEADGTA